MYCLFRHYSVTLPGLAWLGWVVTILIKSSVERCNRDIESMIACWRRDEKRNDGAFGLKEIQYSKNTRFHNGIGRSPFKAMFGTDPVMGVEALGLEKELTEGIETEEQLEQMFPQELLDEEELLVEDEDEFAGINFMLKS